MISPRSLRPFALSAAILGCPIAAFAADPPQEFPPQPPVKALSPQDEQKTFQLPPGYHLELVLSEPDVLEPVACAFDGDGRMYVAEMRTYMQDIDGNKELEPVSRVSVHWSSKGDGVFDKHAIFADHLLLPRMILPLGNGQVVIGETNTNDLNLYTDTDGDGISDKKEPWFQGGPRGGNLEHQPSGLVWALDNGIYTSYNSYRLRWTPVGVVKEPSGNNNGQWGVCQDDRGHLYFTNAGGERGPQSFQVPVVYGGFNPKEQFAPGFEEVWPAVGKADVQGGKSRFRPADGTLNHFTACTGPQVYRGDRLPAELRGDLLMGEPVGRLIRRAKVDVEGGLTVLRNPYQEQKSEFIRSTDPLFRPLNIANAPDGTLYVVDMYRGIIQEGNWVREGSYLRKVVEQYAFDKVVDHGRIWRLVHDTTKPGPQPKMFSETSAQLVAHLDHPNGWWRDTAQKLLILKQDKSVIPALTQMAKADKNPLARVHALWTLEGLDSATPALVHEELKDSDPQVRIAAIRVSESLIKKGDHSFDADLAALTKDKDADISLQALLTLNYLGDPQAKALLAGALAENPPLGVKTIGNDLLHPPTQAPAQKSYTPEEKKVLAAGADVFNTLCATCHGLDGKGLPMVGGAPGTRLAPALAGSKTINGVPEGAIYVLLNGLTGDIDGHKYEGVMISMATNDDKWIASVLSYVRNSFGNHGGFVTPAQVSKLRVATKDRTQPWTIAELRAAVPQPLTNRQEWKLTANHNSEQCALAIDGKPETRYTTGAQQEPGQWFQIELPRETTVSGLELDSSKSPKDYPRGYKVELSSDGKAWQTAATGDGDDAMTEIHFAAAPAKFIRITQTGTVHGLFWSIHELQVMAPPAHALAAAH